MPHARPGLVYQAVFRGLHSGRADSPSYFAQMPGVKAHLVIEGTLDGRWHIEMCTVRCALDEMMCFRHGEGSRDPHE